MTSLLHYETEHDSNASFEAYQKAILKMQRMYDRFHKNIKQNNSNIDNHNKCFLSIYF